MSREGALQVPAMPCAPLAHRHVEELKEVPGDLWRAPVRSPLGSSQVGGKVLCWVVPAVICPLLKL